MKKGLLGSTALIGATALMAGAAGAAEAPTWKLTGNANFQFYYVDQDFNTVSADGTDSNTYTGTKFWTYYSVNGDPGIQDHGWYFGVDEAELQLNVSGTADNGLNYGFKIEINANTDDGAVADEVRLQLSGSWGTLQMGDEDGAEDMMNFGGEDLMGATGGFDGDFDDVLLRQLSYINGWEQYAAPSYPTIVGDTGDATKVTYYSPRFSGFQVGASITPTPNSGDEFKADGGFENHIGLGANYDNSFGDLRIRASAVYSGASTPSDEVSDISAWSVGGIVGWGPFSLGANYTDNGDSAMWDDEINVYWSSESSYWNVAASFETGPLYLSAGYFSSTREFTGNGAGWEDSTFETISVTADYSMAPGLGVYAEIDMITDEIIGGCDGAAYCNNDATIFIAGMNVSF